MAVIPVNQLEVDSVTKTEFLGRSGEVLINAEVRLTDSLINALVRRGITEVYTREERDEIKEILSTRIIGLDDLDLEEEEERQEEEALPSPVEKPAEALKGLSELKDIGRGKDGLRQILRTRKVLDLENRITNTEGLPDRPSGPPLAEKIVQKKVEERTAQYKASMVEGYDGALALATSALQSLRDGGIADGKRIQRLVDGFVETYITDRNILLNISSIKSQSEDYFFNHCLNVCLLAINIAAAAGYSRRQIVEIGMGAILHDVGMMLIPQGIRTKQSELTREERYEIRKHPVLGLHLLEKITNIPESVSYVAYQTHEREDGKGYPKGRKGRFLHYYARIVMIADVFEALSSPRPYRPAYIPYRSMEFLLAFVRKGIFHADLVRAFIDYASLFPVGSLVKLSNDRIGKVIEANGRSHTRPVISVVADEKGNPYQSNKIVQVDLNENRDLRVVQAMPNDKASIEIMAGF